MLDKVDPGFWPTRGRRSSTSSEESSPPFWANRGRRLQDLEEFLAERGLELPASAETGAPPFWANRGRNVLCPEKGTIQNPIHVDEPRWVMFNRKYLEDDQNGSDDKFWITQGTKDTLGLTPIDQEFWVSRGKKQPHSAKRDADRALAALTEDQFWPVRGKRDSDLDKTVTPNAI